MKSPIREYLEKYCLNCDEKGKCDLEGIRTCIAIRLYNLKVYQLDSERGKND